MLIHIFLFSVRNFGTESRIQDSSKIIPPSNSITEFVCFQGHDIKDLYVHDEVAASALQPTDVQELPAPPTPPATQTVVPPNPPTYNKQIEAKEATNERANTKPQTTSRSANAQSRPPHQNNSSRGRQGRGGGAGGRENRQAQNHNPPASHAPVTNQNNASPSQQQQKPRPNATGRGRGGAGNNTRNLPAAGTGEHLLKMRLRQPESATSGRDGDVTTDFDFVSALDNFNKEEVIASLEVEQTAIVKPMSTCYKKDDFFDNISCEQLDREEGRKTRLTPSDERLLNQDTFGAASVGNFRRPYRGGGRNSYSRGGGGRGSGRGYSRGGRSGRGGPSRGAGQPTVTA